MFFEIFFLSFWTEKTKLFFILFFVLSSTAFAETKPKKDFLEGTKYYLETLKTFEIKQGFQNQKEATELLTGLCKYLFEVDFDNFDLDKVSRDRLQIVKNLWSFRFQLIENLKNLSLGGTVLENELLGAVKNIDRVISIPKIFSWRFHTISSFRRVLKNQDCSLLP